MKELIGTDGKKVKIRFKSNESQNPSKLHLKARELIKEFFPLNIVIEEFLIPGDKKLYCDFLLPERNIVIEVHGEQHYKFNPHFYKTKFEYIKAKFRDEVKKDFCLTNNLLFIELPFNKIDEWEKIIYDKCYG